MSNSDDPDLSERAVAFGVLGGVLACDSAAGPILSGFLTAYFSQRWGFGVFLGLGRRRGAVALIPKSQFSFDTLAEMWELASRAKPVRDRCVPHSWVAVGLQFAAIDSWQFAQKQRGRGTSPGLRSPARFAAKLPR